MATTRQETDHPVPDQEQLAQLDQEIQVDPAGAIERLGNNDVTADVPLVPVSVTGERWRDLPWKERLNVRRVTGTAPFYPLGVLFGLNAVDELDRIAFTVLSPEIRRTFDLDLQGVSTIITVIALVNLLLELPIGYLSDRKNRVRLAIIGAAAWTFFTFLTGLAGLVVSLGLLYVARAGSALAKNLGSTHRSLLADYYPVETRARVFYFHNYANSLGQLLGPLVAGGLATFLAWQVPFFLLTIPTIVCVALALRLKEPTRGIQERRQAGADEETALIEEKPAGFAETFRTMAAGKSTRKIWWSLPFLAASLGGIQIMLTNFYEEEFGLGPGARGLITAAGEALQIVGLVGAAVFVQRLIAKDPGKVMKLIALVGIVAAGSILGIALAPVVAVAVAFQMVFGLSQVVLLPGILAVFSLIIPPRMRAMGFASGSVFLFLGVLALPFIGAFGDARGVRAALIAFIPLYLIGAFLLSASGTTINDDMARVLAMTRAQAEMRKRRMEGDPTLLIVRGLDVHYDQTQVLFDVDLDVQEGEILALLGTNGAGKSTLLKAISGINNRSGGVVIFDGEDISTADAMQTAHLGIAQVPGGRGIFPSLTVAENIRAAGWMYRKDKEHLEESTKRILEYFPVLEKRWDTPSGALSGGEQQMLSLAQAFIAKPKLLMIDELSLGLAPTIVEKLLDIVRAIHANGTTIILVEQSVNVALRIARRAVFMEKGEIRFEGPTAELLERTDILRAVFLKGAAAGEEVATAAAGADDPNVAARARRAAARARKQDLERRAALLDGEVVLEARGLTKRYGGVTAVNGVSFELHKGEILGLIGPNGAGKTSIFDLLSGFQKVNEGQVILDGTDVTEWPAWRRAEHGLARSFQDARLWPALTVREAIATSMRKAADITSPLPAMFGLPVAKDSELAVDARVEELIELLGLKAFRDKFIGELSTGSRRMVEFATLLSNDPKVIVLDEPSSGIAQKETEALGSVLREIQRYTDSSILIIEHDMPLISGLADHIVALELGTVISHGTPDEILNHPQVIESYLGNTTYNELQEAGLGAGDTAPANGVEGTARRRRSRPRPTA